MSFDNQNFNGYNNDNQNNINQYPNMSNMFEQRLQSNKWKVQNLQDALTRYSPPNSCGCYFCTIDDQEYEYEIYTDYNGRKSYKVFKRTPCEVPDNSEVAQLLARIKVLEDIVNAKPTTNSNDGSSKMQQS